MCFVFVMDICICNSFVCIKIMYVIVLNWGWFLKVLKWLCMYSWDIMKIDIKNYVECFFVNILKELLDWLIIKFVRKYDVN